MRRVMIVATAFAVAMLMGCMAVGRPFPTQHVHRIETGKTTRAEVKELFGEPWRTGLEDGQGTWTYGYYRYSLFGEGVTRDLVVRFDERGIVGSYSFNSSEPDDL